MTAIEWTDVTWNPTRGCSRVSEGCRHCYAETMAARIVRMGKGKPTAYEGLVKYSWNQDDIKAPRWTGKVAFDADKLAAPLGWRKPRRVFVNSMSDLFHEALTNEQIAAVFGVMAACPQHTFQVLTKRAKRMREWFATPGISDVVEMFRHVAIAGRIEEYFAPERVVDLVDWPGYAVTSKGRVLSMKWGADREMKVMHAQQGHGRVMLYGDGFSERPLVHRLVLSAFDRPAADGEQGCHIDGNATNNALWNLRWGTQSSNWDDRKRHGNGRSYAKLTDDQVSEVRRLADEGVDGAELGRRFRISDTQARNIVSGRQWTPAERMTWPLPSVWLGVSVENQAAADERILDLLATPAAVRFLSCEPLLGAIRLDDGDTGWLTCSGPQSTDDDAECCVSRAMTGTCFHGIDWVIAGCESGPGARPAEIDWYRSLRDQCAAAGAPFFFKQARPEERSSHMFTLTAGEGSKRKPGGVIGLPYIDGVQHVAMPERRP